MTSSKTSDKAKIPEALDDFIAQTRNDAALSKKVRNAVDVKMIADIASEAGFKVSAAQISSLLKSRMTPLPKLSENDLEALAGLSPNLRRGCYSTCTRNSTRLC